MALTVSGPIPSSPVQSASLLTWKVKGRLVHSDICGGALHHMTVRLGQDIPGWVDPKPVKVKTDMNGFFEFNVPYCRTDGRLYIEVIDHPWELQGGERVIGKRIYLEGDTDNFGDVKVNFWEYQKGRPGLAMPEEPLQTKTTAYNVALLAGAAPFKGLQEALRLAGYPLSAEATQKLFPDNLTIKKEGKKKGVTRTADWMGQRILQGFSPSHLIKGEKKGEYYLFYNWDRYELDREYVLPNVKAKLVIDGEKARVVEVQYQWRKEVQSGEVNPPVYKKKQTDTSRLTEWTTVKEGSPEFERALYIFRVAYLASGEVDEHLGAGHLNVEQYAVAAFRNLRDNPLKKLLFPHLREVVMINDAGSEVIFGPTGALTTTTALTAKGVALRLIQKLGHMDWHNWAPRKPLSDSHQFALVENLYWSIVQRWVHTFIDENKEAIKENWGEVKAMSDDLVTHSVPYHRLEGQKIHQWADRSEVDASKENRMVLSGKKVAVRPITMTLDPTEEDIERLKQASAYMIFFSTFWHSWVHNLQKDDAGDIHYGALGLRPGGELPHPREVSTQLGLANTLTSVNYGYILKNENGDIDPRFIAMVKEKEAEFKALGIEPADFIRSCINI